jgi:hypothetical protein
VSPDVFTQRLPAAFEFLEQAVTEKRIKYYGSRPGTALRAEPDSEAIIHWKRWLRWRANWPGTIIIFVSFNAGEPGDSPEAPVLSNQKMGDEYVSVVEAAQSFGITAIASGSLLQGQAARGLPEAIRDALGSLATDAQTGIQFVRSAPGVTTALVGMSDVAHVEENLKLMKVSTVSQDDLIRVFDQED